MILFGLFVGLTSFSPAVAQQPDPKVTLTVQATSVKRALDLLGASAHVQLLTSPQTANDIVTFRFVNVPLSEAMARIADVDNAEWKKEKGTLRLVRSDKLKHAETEWELNRDIQGYARAIADRRLAWQKLTPWSDQEADRLVEQFQGLIKDLPAKNPPPAWRKRGQQLLTQAPFARALQDMVVSMDPVELAGLPSSVKTVWSNHPTKMERPFSPSLERILDQYVQNQASWLRSVVSHSMTPPTVTGNPYWTLQFANLLGSQSKSISTFLLTIDNGHDFSLTAYDEAGKKITTASDSLEPIYQTNEEALKVLFLTSNEKPISLEGDDRLLTDFIRQGPIDQRGPPSDKLRARLLDPEGFDPLHLSGSPLLIRVAEVRGVNMIARLPDSLFDIDHIAAIRGQQPDAAKAFADYASHGGLINLHDGWLTIRPDRPAKTRSIQASRLALAKYLLRLSTNIPLSIDEQARFIAPLPEHQANDLPFWLATYLNCPEAMFFDWPALRFYAEITPQQKERMLTGGMPLSALTTSEHEIVDRMVYGGYLLTYAPVRGNDATDIYTELYASGILSEATEALPNGLPPDGLVKMKIANDLSVYEQSPDNKVYGMGQLLPDTLAMFKYAQDHPEEYKSGNQMAGRDFTHFIVGNRTTITVTFQFTPTLSMTIPLQDGNVTNIRRLSFDDLPQSYRNEYYDAYTKWAKMMSLRRAGSNGKTVPPP